MNPNQILTFVYSNPYALFVVATWTIIWKGLALWKAAKKDSKYWFALILIINTVGILEILYYFFLYKIDFSRLLDSFKRAKIK